MKRMVIVNSKDNMGCKHKECITCPNADRTITYSLWWYCKNPKDFRDFTVCREGTPQPDWCPKTLPKLLRKQRGERK